MQTRLLTGAATAIASTLCVWTLAGAAALTRAQPAAVFTKPQAVDGKAIFAKHCASCHMADLSGNNDTPPLAGDLFLSSWRARTTRDLLAYIAAAMPPGGPTLPPSTVASIGAYILATNGAEAGGDELTAATTAPIGAITKHPD
jgi:mono/diheme cytochrome c family protein